MRRYLNVTHEDIRDDLSRHDLEGQRGGGQEAFHRPALPFARDGQGGDHHHRHRQHDAHQARDDVVLRHAIGIVFEMDPEVHRARFRGEVLQGSGQIAIKCRPGDLVEDLNCGTYSRRIRRVGLNQHRRSLSADEPARKVRGQIENELNVPPGQQVLSGLFRLDMVNDLEIAAVLHRMNKSSRKRAVVRGQNGDRQVLRIRVDGETEKNQLNDRDAKHHCKGEPITPHLDEFLPDDRGETNEVEWKGNHGSRPGSRMENSRMSPPFIRNCRVRPASGR